MENLLEESIKAEKIIMNMASEVYPDKDSLFSIKKKLEIINKKKIIKKRKKINLKTPCLSIIDGDLTYCKELSENEIYHYKYEKISLEIHDKNLNQIRIHKFKILLD